MASRRAFACKRLRIPRGSVKAFSGGLAPEWTQIRHVSRRSRFGQRFPMPTALDNGRRSPHKLLRAVVARLRAEALALREGECDGPLGRSSRGPRVGDHAGDEVVETRNGEARPADLTSAGSDRTPRCRPSARDVGSAIGDNGGSAPHDSQMGRAEEGARGAVAVCDGSRGSKNHPPPPQPDHRSSPCEGREDSSSDPYQELTGMGTSVRDRSGLGLHALPPSA
jgi:hypothetical protein